MMSSKAEMDHLSKRYGVKIEEPICQPGVKIPDPDWSRMERARGTIQDGLRRRGLFPIPGTDAVELVARGASGT